MTAIYLPSTSGLHVQEIGYDVRTTCPRHVGAVDSLESARLSPRAPSYHAIAIHTQAALIDENQ